MHVGPVPRTEAAHAASSRLELQGVLVPARLSEIIALREAWRDTIAWFEYDHYFDSDFRGGGKGFVDDDSEIYRLRMPECEAIFTLL